MCLVSKGQPCGPTVRANRAGQPCGPTVRANRAGQPGIIAQAKRSSAGGASLLLLAAVAGGAIAQTKQIPKPLVPTAKKPLPPVVKPPVRGLTPNINFFDPPKDYQLFFCKWSGGTRGVPLTKNPDGWDGPYPGYGYIDGVENHNFGDNSTLVIPSGGHGSITALFVPVVSSYPALTLGGSTSVDFSSSDNSVSITNPHNATELNLQAKEVRRIRTAMITGTMISNTNFIGNETSSALTVKVVPVKTYKIQLWIVKDKVKDKDGYSPHSSYFQPTVSEVATAMTETWGQQGAINFVPLGSGVVNMTNVDPDGNGIEIGPETERIVKKGLYVKGKNVINIYTVYKLGPKKSVRGRASDYGGLSNKNKRYMLITDISDPGGGVPSHEFGHLCNLQHTPPTFDAPSLLPDLSYWIPYKPKPYNWNLMNPQGYGSKIRWNQVDAAHQFINQLVEEE